MKRSFGAALCIAVLVSCGRSLLEDPSFDLWCGETLCQPWESTGSIQRVKTWHVRDFGVSLEDNSSLSQLSTQARVSCVHFEVIADVTASAQVRLELDFNDDGSIEFDQVIPESRWSKLSFDAPAPRWYRNLRFTLRKAGIGRAVLAQIRATDDGCQAQVPETRRDHGQSCNTASECASGVCEPRGKHEALRAPNVSCGECSSDAQCPDGQRCGTRQNQHGVFAACVPVLQDTGALCEDDGQCESGHCLASALVGRSTCAECADDEECAEGQVCGLIFSAGSVARGCRTRADRELGDACASDGECKSGACANNTCSECRTNEDCADGALCRTTLKLDLSLFTYGPALCTQPAPSRGPGAACNTDGDCTSGACQLPAPGCYACAGDSCRADAPLSCEFPRQLPGTCR